MSDLHLVDVNQKQKCDVYHIIASQWDFTSVLWNLKKKDQEGSYGEKIMKITLFFISYIHILN